MPHYHMNIRGKDDLTRDLEGMDYPDLESARADARLSAKQIIADGLNGGAPIEEAMSKTVEITDARGKVVAEVPFSEGAADDLRGMSPQGLDGN